MYIPCTYNVCYIIGNVHLHCISVINLSQKRCLLRVKYQSLFSKIMFYTITLKAMILFFVSMFMTLSLPLRSCFTQTFLQSSETSTAHQHVSVSIAIFHMFLIDCLTLINLQEFFCTDLLHQLPALLFLGLSFPFIFASLITVDACFAYQSDQTVYHLEGSTLYVIQLIREARFRREQLAVSEGSSVTDTTINHYSE